MTEDDSYCRDLTARFDRDRFLCTQFAPSERRADLLALYAFNLEIAGVRESVSEPLVGQMRLKWWFDRLDDIAAGAGRRNTRLPNLWPGPCRATGCPAPIWKA